MSLNGKRVFLAGAAGMVGTAVAARILSSSPTVLIRAAYRRTRPPVDDPRVEWVQGNLLLAEDCLRLAGGCDLAIMAAATSSGSAGLTTEPWRQVNDNLIMNALMLEAFQRAGVGRVVCIGSATCYQEHEGSVREDQLDWNRDPPPPYFGVGWVTRSVEKLGAFWHRTAGMEIVLVRATNVYGPFARFNPATSNFIPALVRKAVDRMDPFEVWGAPDITRDVIFVEDFAEAVVLLLENRGIVFDVFNLGSGQLVTVGKIVELSLKSTHHYPSRVEWRQDRPGTSQHRGYDCTKVQTAIHWSPRHSIEEGIAKTVRWWTENRDGWKR